MRQKQKLVVCEFVGGNNKAFEVFGRQPSEDITDVKTMVAWCKENISEAGSYKLIREIPGTLDVKVKSETVHSFA